MRLSNVQSTIHEMTGEAMKELFLELSRSVYWPAILKYLDGRRAFAEGGLKTIDAFKEPTNMARTQGVINGVSDLEGAVDLVVEEAVNSQVDDEEARIKDQEKDNK